MGDIVEFVTLNGHQKIFYKITSSAINFEIKAMGNAVIGLAKKVGPECDYLIVLGDNRRSWIKKYHGRHSREKADTPNILSNEEYRRFWVSWYGEAIRLGGDGHTNPIVSYNNYPTLDIKYVTFFVLNHDYQYPVHWKVELPPIIQKPVLKPLTDGELHWVPIDANTHVLPDGVLIGGYEKENLYIIRAKHRGSLTPGKFVPAEGTAYISWGGDAHTKSVFEVLCGFNCMWVPCSKDKIPVGAIVGGYSENIEHEKLYVGRAKYLNYIIPGKVQPSHKVCYIAYDGKEIGVDNYEILVHPETRRSANKVLIPHYDIPDEIEIEHDDDDDEDDDDDDNDSVIIF
ncbi:unnamed protein product [Arctia plantaginis]|uniref:Farnesoic acid O-methyl transferase domain-containing protein n=1 Tax=Arctia plantaginis TaxID=874455 RepID=A0A8S1A0U1_ARCPL|nr:unnamed protein product [Arctia plantaginis]